MILVKVGEKQLYFQKQDGTKKWFKTTPAVIAYVGKTFKVGASLKAEFNKETYIIEKVTGNKKETYKGKSYSGGNNSAYACSDERSVYNAVATMVAGMKLDLKGAKEAVKELFAQGMELIKVKTDTTKSEPIKENNSDQEPGTEETNVPDGQEEPVE
jgi:hypothetical protein